MWKLVRKSIPVVRNYYPQILQFIKFGMVGTSGLLIDISTVYLLRATIGLTWATLVAYFIAASSNWFINRLWTFQAIKPKHTLFWQWLRFILTNILGFCCNRGVVFSLFFISQTCKNTPYIPLIIGAFTGMAANFHLSRKLVYTETTLK